MTEKETPEVTPVSKAKKEWIPPDECPECGSPAIIVIYEDHAIACEECRKKIPC